jgi:hypothetical protein
MLRLSTLLSFTLVPMMPSLLASEPRFLIESPETKVALLELYTSEGCSSCPPAEAWLGTLKENPGLWKQFAPVAFHVDYWNKLGWTDRFALPEFARRQRGHAALWHASTIYTPGLVINGEERRSGGSLTFPAEPSPGRLRFSSEDGARVEISFVTSRDWEEPLIVELVPLAHGVRTNVRRGENAGRELQHEFVALALVSGSLRSMSRGVYTAQLTLPRITVAPVTSMVAWVRPANTLTPIQVAGGWIP